MSRLVALGAEAQAGSSLALAYPEREVLLLSDQAVVDGWDIANATVQYATPTSWRANLRADDRIVPLSARWLADQDWSLTRMLPRAAAAIGDAHVVPISPRPAADGLWQLKGDRWHRPDMPIDGPAIEIDGVTDPHGCGLVYQRQECAQSTIMAIAHIRQAATALAVFRVLEERFFRDVILQAAESVCHDRVIELSLAVLSALQIDGFCTLNWIDTADGPRLTSIRPAARAVFGTCRRGGLDLVDPAPGVAVLPAGLHVGAQPHYASYHRLPA